MHKFDLVTFLITLAGRVAERRLVKAQERVKALAAARRALDKAHLDATQAEVDARYKHQDIKRVS